MAQRGGKRPGAGRPAGRKDKATVEHLGTIEELARSHTEVALGALVAIARAGESEAARVSAANALLDRGYGRPKQAMEHTGADGGPIKTEDVNAARDELFSRIGGLSARAEADGSTRKPH